MVSDLKLATSHTLEFTGERYLTEVGGDIELEHMHRYMFCRDVVSEKVVLDIACGEGYGSHFISEFAKTVIGMDVSQEAVEHAKRKYVKENLKFEVGECQSIPLEDNSVDVVVSFETIEHHDKHVEMISEIKRVLCSNGILIISSPNKLEYTDKRNYQNEFHVKELYREEFLSLLSSSFKNTQVFGQRIVFSSVVASESNRFQTSFSNINAVNVAPSAKLENPMYFIAISSNEDIPNIENSLLEQDLDKSSLSIELSDVRKNSDAQIEYRNELIKIVKSDLDRHVAIVDALNADLSAANADLSAARGELSTVKTNLCAIKHQMNSRKFLIRRILRLTFRKRSQT